MNTKNTFFCLLLSLSFLQCKRKEEVFTSDPEAQLSFSVSEVNYDTVFAGMTYPTRRIKVYNRNSQALSIDEISLAGGVASLFTVLVNGQAGPVVSGLELMGGDSMIIIINLFFGLHNQSTPYLLNDAIRFQLNGQEQQVLLKAVGEDALLVSAGNLPCAQVWDSQKTVILLGETVVTPGCTLTINKGTQVLASSGSSLDIKGTLLIKGEKTAPVYITSVVSGRSPGQWLGIRFFQGSTNNALSWLVLSNAESGLSVLSPTPLTWVDIALDHATFYDFTLHALDLSYVSLEASNCLFMASANNLTNFSLQGDYAFRHCTWAGYSYDYYRDGPCIRTSNIFGTLTLSINHSIIWGDKTNEFELDATTTVNVDTSIVKTNSVLSGQGQLRNQDPKFASPVNRNFQLTATSPAMNRGVPSLVTDDLKGALRDLTPDLGCYEFVP